MDLKDFDLSRFKYDPTTGVITSRGRRVGVRMQVGYLAVSLTKTQRVTAQRLAWFLSTGEQPARIDHKNHDTFDNRLRNLRAASVRQNAYNSRRRADNKSGHKGVCWSAQKNKWRACIQLPTGKQKHIGFFDTVEAAAAAWVSAAKTIHGEFFHAG